MRQVEILAPRRRAIHAQGTGVGRVFHFKCIAPCTKIQDGGCAAVGLDVTVPTKRQRDAITHC